MTTENETIFTATTVKTESETQNTATSVTLPQEVSELVGQGKKYASVEDALKSVPHAQKHISTLEQELQAAKAELEKRKTAEQLLDEIKSGITTTEKPSPSSVTTDNVAQMIEQVLQAEKAKETATTNIGKVTSAFKEKFGEKAEEVYNTLAQEAGLSVPMLNKLAATSPSAVLKLAGLSGKKDDSVSKITSSVNTAAMNQTEGTSSLSSRLKPGASTKDLVSSWKIAGQKVGKPS